jgi:hypothetical protein
VLLCHLPPTESSADDLLWPDASVRRNTAAKQMTPFGVSGKDAGARQLCTFRQGMLV